MSRRRLALLLCAVLVLLSGCGRQDSGSVPVTQDSFGSVPETPVSVQESVPEVTEARGSGSFSMPINESYGWNPYACMGMENRAVMQLIYEGLFTTNSQFDPEPLLCKSFTVSDSGLVYTLELREASFSSGASLTASDVVYSMEQAALSELYSSRFRDIAAYYVSGVSTVVVELSAPNDRLPCLLTFPIIPAGASPEAAPGTGPFVRNGSTVMTQNPKWWGGPNNLNFQTVTLYSSASAEDTRDAFEIDAVHFVYNNPSASTAASFHCDYELWNSRGTVMGYLGFNFNYGIFQDQAVRAAVTHAIDRTSIAESVYHNFADAAALPVAPSSSMYDQELAQRFAFTSVTEARKELMDTPSFYLPEDLANPSPSPLPQQEDQEDTDEDTEDTGDGEAPADQEDALTYNNIIMLVRDGNLSRVATAKQVAQNLTDVGFTVELKILENDEYIFSLYNTEWDLYYGEVTLKPDFDLRSLLSYDGSMNYGGLAAPETLFSLAASARENSGNRYDYYEYIMEQGYLCPVLFINNAVFTTRGVFTGLNPSPDYLFYDITKIRVNHS